MAYYDKNIPFFFGGIRRIAIGNRKKRENSAKKYTRMVYLANMHRSRYDKLAQKKTKKIRTYYYTGFFAVKEQENSAKFKFFFGFSDITAKNRQKTPAPGHERRNLPRSRPSFGVPFYLLD